MGGRNTRELTGHAQCHTATFRWPSSLGDEPGRIAMQHRGNVVKHWHNLCYVTWQPQASSTKQQA